MRINEVCSREVIICHKTESIAEVARLMRLHHVGSVLVVNERDGKRIPTGIITDRDLTVEVMALGISPDSVTAADVKSSALVTVDASADVFETLERMRYEGVRRMPVVDAAGALVGIVTLDDLMELLSEQLGLMAKLVSREQLRERLERPPRSSDEVTASTAH